MLLKAMELCDEGTEDWARCASSAFQIVYDDDRDEVCKPEWWNDEELKALSARVVAAEPHTWQTCYMRATVLCAFDLGPRIAAEIKQAATWFRRAVAFGARCPDELEDYASELDQLADRNAAWELLAEEEKEKQQVANGKASKTRQGNGKKSKKGRR